MHFRSAVLMSIAAEGGAAPAPEKIDWEARAKEAEANLAAAKKVDAQRRAQDAEQQLQLIEAAKPTRDQVILAGAAEALDISKGEWTLDRAWALLQRAEEVSGCHYIRAYGEEKGMGVVPKAHGWPCTSVAGTLVCLKLALPPGGGLPARWAPPDLLDRGPL